MGETYSYEKYDENGMRHCPMNDLDGSVTGHIVLNVRAWFDEHPEERKALGWIRHIHPDPATVEYNKQSQYIISTLRVIDDYTMEDVYRVMDKSEEMMLFEEMAGTMGLAVVYGMYEPDANGGIMYGRM